MTKKIEVEGDSKSEVVGLSCLVCQKAKMGNNFAKGLVQFLVWFLFIWIFQSYRLEGLHSICLLQRIRFSAIAIEDSFLANIKRHHDSAGHQKALAKVGSYGLKHSAEDLAVSGCPPLSMSSEALASRSQRESLQCGL